jgi:cysteinyl-tRNA synthetase
MSKSLGNFTTLTDMLDRTDPRAYRLLVLQSHYRSPLEVTPATVERAEHTLRRLDEYARRVAAAGLAKVEPDAATIDTFRAHMDDDMQTPAAMALLSDTVRHINVLLDDDKPDDAAPLVAAVEAISAAVGLELHAGEAHVDSAATDLIARRDAARTRGDWATADALRAELEAEGWMVKDTPAGTHVHR